MNEKKRISGKRGGRTDAPKGPMELCPFCNERPATLLCDFVIGFSAGAPTEIEKRYYSTKTGELELTVPAGTVSIAENAEMFTCDRPICAECATNEGHIHYCGKHCEHDTIDLCPQCKDSERDGCRPLTGQQAQLERERMWKRSNGMLRSTRPRDDVREASAAKGHGTPATANQMKQ